MENLKRKIDLLVALSFAEDEETRKCIREELRAQMASDAEADKAASVEEEVENMLRLIGVPHNQLGHRDLSVALCITVNNPDIIHAMVKELYPRVAETVGEGRTVSRVERAIRHSIETAWDRCDRDVLYELFGNTISSHKGKPTNSEFISQITYYIRRKLKM